MKFFLDSAKLDEIKQAYHTFGIDGVTTNPRHIMLSGKPFKTAITDIANWIKEEGLEGIDRFPVSVEINPHLEDKDEMIKMAKEVAAISPNFAIKIPCTEAGVTAAKELEQQGIRTNVTLVFSRSQALAVARLGAKFVSPFVGWKENFGEDTASYLQDIVETYRNYSYDTEIIVAAVRSGKVLADAARMGADIVTCSLEVMKNSVYHPFTDYGLRFFTEAWNAVEAME